MVEALCFPRVAGGRVQLSNSVELEGCPAEHSSTKRPQGTSWSACYTHPRVHTQWGRHVACYPFFSRVSGFQICCCCSSRPESAAWGGQFSAARCGSATWGQSSKMCSSTRAAWLEEKGNFKLSPLPSQAESRLWWTRGDVQRRLLKASRTKRCWFDHLSGVNFHLSSALCIKTNKSETSDRKAERKKITAS